MGSPPGVPLRPGPVGRLVRLGLGLAFLQLAVEQAAVLAGGVSGWPDPGDTRFVAGVLLAAWLTPLVYDIGLRTAWGNRWRVLAAGAVAVSTAAGAVAGAPGTALSSALLSWVALTLGWLGVSLVLAAVLRTPGCEMRSLPHLASRLLPGGRDFVACPGPLRPLHEWEARRTGRATPVS